MPTVLVLDDAAIERKMVRILLSRSEEWTVLEAETPEEAYSTLQTEVVEIVLCDLRMPQQGGLEVLAELQERYPTLPVIIMTSQGSERDAFQALKQGAASYLPKELMGEHLLALLERIASVSRRDRHDMELMHRLSELSTTFTLQNERDLLTPLITFLQDRACDVGVCSEKERVRLGIALEEALLNALIHGNLEVSSALREQDNDAFERLIEFRTQQPEFRSRRIFVTADLNAEEAKFVIRDEGSGFDVSALPDPTLPENLFKASGRGVLLMQTFVDEVHYNETGNEVTLIKRKTQEVIEKSETETMSAAV